MRQNLNVRQPSGQHWARKTRQESLLRPLSPPLQKINPQWHVLQVRQRFERIVALRLRERAIEGYVRSVGFVGKRMARPMDWRCFQAMDSSSMVKVLVFLFFVFQEFFSLFKGIAEFT